MLIQMKMKIKEAFWISKMNKKESAALVSVTSNCFLILIKVVAGFISGSISIISEAVHSLSDLCASFIAFVSVKKSKLPPDVDHQFGHQKYEDLAGLIEGLLIIFAGVYIIYEACSKIIFHKIDSIDVNLGILVMFISSVVNIFVSAYLMKIGKKTKSIAIMADAKHLHTDILTSGGIFLSLIAIKFTNLWILDPIIALLVSVFIIEMGFKTAKNSSLNLLDTSLNKSDLKIIENIINSYNNEFIELKTMRTRKNGLTKMIELTLLMNDNCTIHQSHIVCDELETLIAKKLGNTDVLIHVEPKCSCQKIKN